MADSSTGPVNDTGMKAGENAASISPEGAWLRTLFEQSPDPIFVEDEKGYVLNANPAACRLHGLAHGDLVGKHVLDLVPESAHPRVRANWERWVDGSMTSCEGESLSRDGKPIPVEIRASHITYDGKDSLLFVVRDISRRRAMEGQHAQAEKMEALGKLAGGIAHDFNNLLMVILNNASFVREEIPDGSPVHQDLDQLTEATNQAAALTSQLLCFSRKQMFCPRPAELVGLVRGMRVGLQATLGEGIRLLLELPDAPLWVKADPQQVEQGLTNLAINARDAMEEGGQVTLCLSTAEMADQDPGLFVEVPPQRGAYVRIEMKDMGKGVEPSLRQRIFDPFFTTKSRGRGTGLGLSTTYGMVRQHDGYMSVDSAPGGGSSFSIYLPCGQHAESHAVSETPLPAPAAGRGTILLAEDSGPVRTATRRMLERLGYQVLEAADGLEALDVAAREEKTIDLLFTDVVMPNMDGKTLADEMCQRYPDTKVVFASGYPEDHLKDHGLIERNVALLQKPFNRDQVARAVASVMDY